MDRELSIPSPVVSSNGYDTKTILIIVLVVLLFLVVIAGTAGASWAMMGLDRVGVSIWNGITSLLSLVGYATGTLINTGADVTTDVAKFGVDVADGTAHTVGNILLTSSNGLPSGEKQNINDAQHLMPITVGNIHAYAPSTGGGGGGGGGGGKNNNNAPSLDHVLQHAPPPSSSNSNHAVPDSTDNPIQKPMGSQKSNWCLAGEYMGRRGCVELANGQTCKSGQMFDSQSACSAPPFTTSSR